MAPKRDSAPETVPVHSLSMKSKGQTSTSSFALRQSLLRTSGVRLFVMAFYCMRRPRGLGWVLGAPWVMPQCSGIATR